MKRATIMTVGTALLLFGSVAEAEAGARSGTVNGPRGGSMSWHRQCSDGTCERSFTATGPAGRTYSRESSVSRDGNGNWQRDVTVTGPRGGTYERHGQGSCHDAACSFSGTVTGPRGNTGVYSGEWHAD